MKIKLFVTCEIQYFEIGIFSFNSYVYYLSRGFIVSARAFNLLTRVFNLPTRSFNLPTRAFNHETRAFRLPTRGFELVTRNSCFTFHAFTQSYPSSMVIVATRPHLPLCNCIWTISLWVTACEKLILYPNVFFFVLLALGNYFRTIYF